MERRIRVRMSRGSVEVLVADVFYPKTRIGVRIAVAQVPWVWRLKLGCLLLVSPSVSPQTCQSSICSLRWANTYLFVPHVRDNAVSKQSPTSPATAIERTASGGHRAGQWRERARPAEQAPATTTRTSTMPTGERAQQSGSTSGERIRRLRRANAATPACTRARGQARWWPASAWAVE